TRPFHYLIGHETCRKAPRSSFIQVAADRITTAPGCWVGSASRGAEPSRAALLHGLNLKSHASACFRDSFASPQRGTSVAARGRGAAKLHKLTREEQTPERQAEMEEIWQEVRAPDPERFLQRLLLEQPLTFASFLPEPIEEEYAALEEEDQARRGE